MQPIHATKQHPKVGTNVGHSDTLKKVGEQVPPTHKGLVTAVAPDSHSGKKAVTALPIRTRAEGGRKRRK